MSEAILFSPKVLELLTSRMCHDLISPVGAVNNGVELVTELGLDAGAEAISLIASSAEQAARRLKIFRLAYGAAGAAPGLDPRDVRAAVLDYFAGSRIDCQWSEEDALALKAIDELPVGCLKGALLGVLLLGETIRKDGVLTIKHDILPEQITTVIRAEGEGVDYHQGVEAALSEQVDVESLTPRSVHAYITPRTIGFYNGDFAIGKAQNGFKCMISFTV